LNSEFFAALKSPVQFLIIRHGQSEGNAEKILQGRGEYALSEKGREQARKRGRSLKALLEGAPKKNLFFSSPQQRAGETARIIAGEAGLAEPVYRDELVEMDLGIWTGKNWEQARNDEPELWNNFRSHSWDAIPGAESSASLYRRSLRIWAMFRSAALDQGAERIIAVTHGGLIQWLIKSTLGCRSWFPLFPIGNCGLFTFCAEPAGKNAYTCWEEINSPIPDAALEPRGFPS
jgi:broad specificity phosphatase PhoE